MLGGIVKIVLARNVMWSLFDNATDTGGCGRNGRRCAIGRGNDEDYLMARGVGI